MICVYSPNYGRQRHFEVCSKVKNVIRADFGDENEMNYTIVVPTSSEMRNIMKSMRSYVDTYSNGEMNSKRDEIE
ncbi:hypothetical protein TNCV_2727901 [Trichonephila clavipes]|nr:hypothetical protein TNCV_2727901 [Trichonephila clavipes]